MLLRHAGRAFDDRAVAIDCILRQPDPPAFRDADLRLHDVDPGDHLGHRVFDLDTRVHLDEVELAGVGIHQELDGARMRIADRAHQAQRGFTQCVPAIVIEVRRRCAFDHLLVAPLHRAVTLVQMHDGAVRIAEHLHLDVTRVAHELLDIHLVVAECGQRLTSRDGQQRFQVALVLEHAHPAPAAAPARLQHQRIADFFSQRLAGGEIVRQRRGRGHHRHAGGDRRVARGHLVAERAHHVGRRADPADARIDHGLREFGVLGQEAVAGVDRIDIGLPCDAQDVVDVEIRGERLLAFADQIALVRLEAMQRQAVFLRIDRHRADVQLGGGTHHANRDFRAVRDQDGLDGGWSHGSHGWFIVEFSFPTRPPPPA